VLAALATRAPFPQGRAAWVKVAAIGFSTNVVYLALLYVSLRHLSAGMSAIIASTNPLVLALLAPILLHESLGWRKLAGLLIGFGGVVFLMVARAGLPTEMPRDEALSIVAFFASEEVDASNILLNRLSLLEDAEIITRQPDSNQKNKLFVLNEKVSRPCSDAYRANLVER